MVPKRMRENGKMIIRSLGVVKRKINRNKMWNYIKESCVGGSKSMIK